MTSYLVANLAYISAANARIEGMRTSNLQRQHRGESMAYTEDHFFAEANELEALAVRVLNYS